MTTTTGTPRDSKPGLAMAAMSLSLHPTPNVLSSSLQRVVQHLLDRPLVQQHQTKESSRAMDHAELSPIQALPQLPRGGSPHAESVSELMLLPLKSTVDLIACRRRRNAAMGSGVSMAVSMSTGGVEGSRRSRLRRLLNDIIRKHNDVVPPGSDTTAPRFDAEHLPPPPPPQLPGGRRIVLPTADQKHVLILMSDTGGGHRASAEALKATFELEYGNKYLVTIVDLWKEHTPWPFNQMPKSYSFMVKHEALWKVAFHATKPRFVHQPQMAATAAFVAREVSKALDMYRPDVIVSVHPLMQHIPLRVLRSRGLLDRIPFTTVITDLTTCHPTWFHKLVTLCFCPTEEVAQRAMKAGLQQSQLRVHGLPIRPAFVKPTGPQEELRKELGMDPHLPAALLIGGGEGMGPVEATARALAQSLGAIPSDQGEGAGAGGGSKATGQLVVVCGRNRKLREKLEKIDWPMPTLVKGFVTNMPDVMAACDCIITKAGPGTIAESLIRGLPMVLNGFIAGQEAGNVPFVVDNGAGKFCDKPAEIAKIVANWFGDGAKEFQQMSVNARSLARPEAVFKIVRDLDGLVSKNDLLKSVQSQQQEQQQQQPAQVAIVQ